MAPMNPGGNYLTNSLPSHSVTLPLPERQQGGERFVGSTQPRDFAKIPGGPRVIRPIKHHRWWHTRQPPGPNPLARSASVQDEPEHDSTSLRYAPCHHRATSTSAWRYMPVIRSSEILRLESRVEEGFMARQPV
jgi:hypothetical protein